ncbi:MAG: hypothetical protein IKA19_05110 [Muribaculaceae bacterium]|nr:hypothetical protein [Muribaculaceae bacterium]
MREFLIILALLIGALLGYMCWYGISHAEEHEQNKAIKEWEVERRKRKARELLGMDPDE